MTYYIFIGEKQACVLSASKLNHHDNIDENISTESTADPFPFLLDIFPLDK